MRFKQAYIVSFIIVTLTVTFISLPPSVASGGDFLFGNHIYTGQTDSASGLPIARHPRGAAQDEECGVDVDCKTGWVIYAKPGEAKFLYHTGVNGEDHPVWLVNRVQIPQPGSFTHFHWITTTSSDPRAASVPAECDVTRAGQLENLAEDSVCPGWFMQITAARSFAFQHGNEIIPIRPGQDNASHLKEMADKLKTIVNTFKI